jgi:UDP-3-O-[3-hydroxymyristoyl] glucosamine N-acyltransferase
MTTTVHSTAVVGPEVTLGDGVVLHPYVVVLGTVHLGDGTEVFPGAVIGKPPALHPTLSRPTTRGGSARVGAGCSIGAHAVIYEGVELGADTLVGDLASIRERRRATTSR